MPVEFPQCYGVRGFILRSKRLARRTGNGREEACIFVPCEVEGASVNAPLMLVGKGAPLDVHGQFCMIACRIARSVVTGRKMPMGFSTSKIIHDRQAITSTRHLHQQRPYHHQTLCLPDKEKETVPPHYLFCSTCLFIPNLMV